MIIKFKETKLLNKDNFQDTITKAIQNLDDYELSDYKFEREYQEALIKYFEEIIDSAITGLALKLDVDPTLVNKSYKFSQLTLLKASQGELSDESFLLKSLWQDLKEKYTKATTNFKKFFSKFKPLEPMKISGKLVYNPETKKDLTFAEYRNIENGIITYLKDTIGDPNEEITIRAGLFGLLKKKMDDDKISKDKQKNMSYDDIYSRYGEFVNDTSKAKRELFKKEQMKQAIEYSKKHSAEYLSIDEGELKNKIVKMFRKQIVGGLEDGISKSKMISRLYWIDPSDELGKRFNEETVRTYNRDLRKIVITEYSYATNEGYLAASKDDSKSGEKLYFVFSGRNNSKEKEGGCNQFLGKICLLADEPQDTDFTNDEYADFLIWSGKTNVGRKGSNWWCCIPVHPHCTHYWARIYPEFQQWNSDTESIELKEFEKSVQNMDMQSGKAELIKDTLTPVINKIKKYLRIKQQLIIRLYKEHNKGANIRSMHDEGIIILYESSPDYVGDVIHEIGHYYYHFINLDNNKKVNKALKEIKSKIEKDKNYNRIFFNEHTISNEREIYATLFKWYMSGIAIDKTHLEILKNNCPYGYDLIEENINPTIKKSLVFFTESQLLKAFIQAPLTKEKRIDFKKVPIGSTIWITKEGKHIPITRFTKDKFAVDFQAARNAGYTYRKEEAGISHLVFKIDEKGRPIKTKEKKELTPKQIERKETSTKKKEIRKQIFREQKLNKNKVTNALIINREKEIAEKESLKNNILDKIKEFNLKDDQKETYVQAVMEEVNKIKKQSKLESAFNIMRGKQVEKVKQSFSLINPIDAKDEYDLINKVKDGLYENEGNKITFSHGISETEAKKINKEELKEKINNYKQSIERREAFERENKKITKERVDEILKIGIENIKITEEDTKASNKLFKQTKNNSGGKSLYTVISKYWADGGFPPVEYLACKTSVRQLGSLMAKYSNINIDMKRMVESVGIEKSVQLLAAYLKNNLRKDTFDKLKNNVERYYSDEMENIENNTLDKVERLKNELKNIKTKITTGKTYDKEAEYSLVKNLIKQRNTVGSAYGMLKSTSEFLNALKKTKKDTTIEVELSNDKEKAKDEYRNFTFYKDRKNTKLKMSIGGNKMVIHPNSLDEFYIKESTINKNENNKLNNIKHSEKGIKKDSAGNEYVDYKPPFFKDKFSDGTPVLLKPSQRNDIRFLKANGGKGIISRSVGAGKTMIATGFHAEMLAHNPNYSTIFVVPEKQVDQQVNEMKKFTDLKIVGIPEDLSVEEKINFMEKTPVRGRMIVMSHSDLANHSEVFKNKKINNLTIDEPQEIFFDKNGNIKSKGKDIISHIKTEHRIALTASPVQDNPSDIYNLIHWVDKDGSGRRGNFRDSFGDKEKYNINGTAKIDNYSFTDMNLGKQNLMREYYRDIIDKYVTNDNLIKRSYKVNKTNKTLKLTPEINKKLLANLNKSKVGLNKYIEETPQYFRESYPASWKERRKQMFVENVVANQIKLANRIEGNPKTKDLIRNIKRKADEKHVIYVDDIEHQNSVIEELKNNKYPEEQIYSMLGGKKISVEQKNNWTNSDKPGLLFISRKQVSGHNLQAANSMHKLGTMFTGIEDIQVDGRVPRGDRKENVDIINYQYNTIYENNLRNKISSYKDKLSTIDTSILPSP